MCVNAFLMYANSETEREREWEKLSAKKTRWLRRETFDLSAEAGRTCLQVLRNVVVATWVSFTKTGFLR